MAIDAPLYTGAPTFLRLPQCDGVAMSDADALVLGAPFDLATTSDRLAGAIQFRNDITVKPTLKLVS